MASLSVGIIGLPNVGKSTLFQALTKKPVDIANYPFCTIDPNVGVVQVPDERLEKLAELFQSKKVVPAIVEFVDIAGLVRGASKGEGLGNQFLSHIREVQAIVHVLRCFESKDIAHVEEVVDPVRDMDIIHTELMLKDLETVERKLAQKEKEAKAGKKEIVKELEELKEVHARLSAGVPPIFDPQNLQLLSTKPVLFVLNTLQGIPPALQKKLDEMKAVYIVLDCKEELEITEMTQQAITELGLKSKLPEFINKAYELLHLISFFTAGPTEAHAWTVRKGTKAPQAGGVIHSDFEEKFIRASVIPWDALLEAGGYTGAVQKGLVRTEGKEYEVQDGDVIEIKHG